MKKLPTKDDVRRELNKQIADYLTSGQQIAEIPKGISGRDPLRALPTPIISQSGKQTRTSLHEVAKTIEDRKKNKEPANASLVAHNARLKRRETILYDDFGEPLRRLKPNE